MTTKKAAVDRELDEIIRAGVKLLDGLQGKEDGTFVIDYQSWYTQAARVVEILLPERSAEFRGYYEIDPKRKRFDYATITPLTSFRTTASLFGQPESNLLNSMLHSAHLFA